MQSPKAVSIASGGRTDCLGIRENVRDLMLLIIASD
jgi:hypothetical protein